MTDPMDPPLTPLVEHHPSFKSIAIATLVVVILTAVAMPFVIRAASSAASNSAAVRDGNDLASCRSAARSLIDDANKDLTLLVIRGLRASAEGDSAQLSVIARESVEAEGSLVEATAAYRRAIRESVDHPRRFLEECRR